MNALTLFPIAMWIWVCLVMLPNNHMRIAIFGPVFLLLAFIFESMHLVGKIGMRYLNAISLSIGRL